MWRLNASLISCLVDIFAAFPQRSKWPVSPCRSDNVKTAIAPIAEAVSGTKRPLNAAEPAAGFANDPPGFGGHSESRVINWGRFKEDLQVTSCAAGGSVIIQRQQQPAQCPWWMVTLASVDSASEWWLILKHNAATTFVIAVGVTIYTGGCRHLSKEGSTGDYYRMDSTAWMPFASCDSPKWNGYLMLTTWEMSTEKLDNQIKCYLLRTPLCRRKKLF